MRKNKKKGTSFVIVVFVTAILFTTATTMIAVVTNDYKTRINESKKVENMYQSDSGLDVAYNVIVKNSEAADLYSTNVLSRLSGDATKNRTDAQINEAYKAAFYEFLLPTSTQAGVTIESNKPITKKDLTSADRSSIPIIYGIANLKYTSVQAGIDPTTISDKSDYYNNWNDSIQAVADDSNRTITVLSYKVTKNNGVVTGIVVNLESTFKSDETKSTGFANTKTIQTKYTITAPDFNKGKTRSKGAVAVDTYAVEKAIVADGDLTVTGGNTKINGDIWIKGTDFQYGDTPKYAYDKYQKGITINKATFNVAGNVATNKTYNLQNEAKSEITTGNLYALNAYVGPSGENITSDGNLLNVQNSLVTNNDLTLNSDNSKIILNNYYGISDISDKMQEEGLTKEQVARKSSSIIVNKNNKGSIEAETAYVHGVAYIDTKTKYQTGESISVKGNAVAYTERLSGRDQDVQIVNYDPLSLLEYKNGATVTAVEQKTNQFYDYFKQTQDIKDGGIKIAKLYSIGAGVNNKEVVNKSWSNENEQVVKSKQDEYALNVFEMGNHIAKNGLDSESMYYNDNGTNMITVGHQNPQINFSAITQNFIEARSSFDNYGKLVLNKDASKPITIEGTNVSYDGKSYSMDNGSGQIEAFIITNSDVIIKGKVDFVGSIITSANVKIEGNEDKTITFNDLIIRDIVAQYASDFAKGANKNHNFVYEIVTNQTTKLFNGAPLTTSVKDATIVYQKPDEYVKTDESRQGTYDANKYLKKGIWKLIGKKGEVIDQ